MAVPERLDSWKAIAAYLKRDVTTVQRWERREGMPVHRHVHAKQGSVYAFRAELDGWWASRRGRLPDAGDTAAVPLLSVPPEASLEPPVEEPTSAEAADPAVPQIPLKRRGWRFWVVIGTLAAELLLGYAAFRVADPARETWRNPLANATFTRLTDWPGIEQAAEIARDGRWASFLADHDGHMDAWLTRIGSGSYRNLTAGDHRELAILRSARWAFRPTAHS